MTHGFALFIFCVLPFLPDFALLPKAAGDPKVIEAQTEDQLNRISVLLAEIKKNPIRPNRNAVASLQQLSDIAMPQILTELKNATGPLYRFALIEILSEMPSPDRDEAFFIIAQELDSWPYGLRSEEAIQRVLSSLARSGYSRVLPLLQRYSQGDFQNNTQFYARIALNILGHPLPPKPIIEVVKISPQVTSALESGRAKQLFAIAVALLEQGPLSIKGGVLYQIEELDHGKVLFRGKGNSETSQELWSLNITQTAEHEASVFASAYYGYSAKLSFINGRWLLTDWHLVWMQ